MPLSEDALNVLQRSSQAFGTSLDRHRVRQLLLDEAPQAIRSDNALVLFGDEQPNGVGAECASLIDQVRESAQPQHTGQTLCAPIRAGTKAFGVIALQRDAEKAAFTIDEEKFLDVLAGLAGTALERARLQRQESRWVQLEQDLNVAQQIQLTLVPSQPPDVPGWNFSAVYRAARDVGGDFYDFMNHAIADGHLGLAIADVTGKGVPAALMMAYSRAVLRASSINGATPADVLEKSNELIMQERHSGLFVSAFYAEIELQTGRMTYASAGHDPPLWIKSGGSEVVELTAVGSVLGAYRDPERESRSIVLDPGDTVVLFTDGVTEARRDDRQLYGDERLRAVAATAAAADGGPSAQSILESVLESVRQFTGDAEQADDLTVVVVQRNRQP